MKIKVLLEDKCKLLVLGFIIVLAFAVRLYFAIDGSKYYFGEVAHSWRDTYTYLDAFKNWLYHGTYQFDLLEPDSRFFRPPVYPFFLGGFYLLSEDYEKWVAFSQVLIDTTSCLITFLITKKITQSFHQSALSAAIYASYPFVIVWVPILYTEILIAHLMLLVIYSSLHIKPDTKIRCFLTGILIGLLFLTKQYMILVGIFTAAYILLHNWMFRDKIYLIIVFMAGIAVTLTPWVLRNFLVSGDLVLTRGESTGIVYVGRDFEAFERFVNLFDQNVTPYRSSIAHSGVLHLEQHPVFRERHKLSIEAVAQLAYECGPSFTSLRGMERHEVYAIDCTDEVVRDFTALTERAWAELPLSQLFQTRLDAATKVFTGNIQRDSRPLYQLLYGYRFALLLVGMLALWSLFGASGASLRPAIAGILMTWLVFASLFALYYVHVEIRYMMIPDILMILSVPIGLSVLSKQVFGHLLHSDQ